jgi:hypothetical protein
MSMSGQIEIDDDTVQQRLQRCIPELSAEFYDLPSVEPNDLISVLNEHGLYVVPIEEFDDEY